MSRSRRASSGLVGVVLSCLIAAAPAAAQTVTATVGAGANPFSVALNPLTNKIYVANRSSNTVTVIDGATNTTTTVAVGTNPWSVGINPATNKIYVANAGSNDVTVIDGATNATSSVAVGPSPRSVAVNPVTNQVYVANYNGASVTAIDGATSATTTVAAGVNPFSVAVNPVTNQVYVANYGSASVTVIDGATSATTTVAVGPNPYSVAVNPVTNQVYVVSYTGASVAVIDGATNATSTVTVGTNPVSVAVNPVTNKIYVANRSSNNVTVIDGSTSATTTVAAGGFPRSVAVNPVTNKISVANEAGANVTVIDGATNATVTLAAGTQPYSVAANPVTNKIYVANQSSANVTVIDGATNVTVTVAAGALPFSVAVNPVTNKIYVANQASNDVTVIDGATNLTATVAVGTGPLAVAVNPVTNQIYVANYTSNDVTVIDGATHATTTVAAGTNPYHVAVNPVTNQVYVANFTSNDVTVIDGTTHATTTVATGTGPIFVAVNPVTNKIYVANYSSANVTVIDGVTNATATVGAGSFPRSVAVNPVTDKVYVANSMLANNVTVIDGATNATTTVPTGTSPYSVAVNPVTNKIYVANRDSSNVTVIDGATNATTTVPAGSSPYSVAVNPVTNKIYVARESGSNVTVIDGATNVTTTVATGAIPWRVAVNPVTNKIYFANQSSANVTVLSEQAVSAIPLTTTIVPLAGGLSYSATPTFTLTAVSTFAPTPPPVQGVLTQVDTWQGSWQAATPVAGTFTATTSTLGLGTHVLYAYAVDGQDGAGRSNGDGSTYSPLVGSIAAYVFTVVPPAADLSIVKTDSADPVNAGGSLDYSLAVSNAGPSTADALTVTDTLPAGVTYVAASGTGWVCGELTGTVTCTRPSLAVGAAPAITVTVTAPAEGGTLNNTAAVSAGTADPASANNSDGESTGITAQADLSVVLSDSSDPVAMSQAYAYTLATANAGPSTATSVSVTLNLPAGVGFVSAAGPGWSCGEAAGVVSCTRASLATGSAPVTVNVTAPVTPGLLTAAAAVSSGTADPVAGNDADSETTTASSATPIYVRTDGSDAVCDGTADASAASAPACAVATVQKGVTNVTPGGQVLVRNGTYLRSNTAITKPVTIDGESRAGVVIGPDLQDDHQNSGLGGTVSSAFLVQATDVTIRKLTIDGDANPGLPGTQNFRNGVVTDFRIAGAAYDRTIVEDVSFANLYRRGYYLLSRTPGDPAGAYLSTGNVIRDSSFAAVGSILQHRDASGAIVLLESSALVENNTVTGGANGVLSNYLTTAAVAPLLTARGNTFVVTNTAFNASGLADGSQIGGSGAGQGNTITLAGALSVPEGQNGVGILVQYATGDVLVEGNSVTGSATDAGAWLYQDNFPLQPVVLRGNRFVSSSSGSAAPGQGVGVLVTDDPALFGESGSGPSYALLESNDVRGFVRGVHLWRNGPSGGSTVEAALAFNRLVGNQTGLDNSFAGFSVPAENNWWGCSYGPGSTGAGCAGTADGTAGSVDTNPWLTLTASAPAGPVALPGTYAVTASLRTNSDAVVTGPPYLPAGVPVAFTTSLAGSAYVAPPTTLGASQAVATLGSTALGSTTACALVDSQSACVGRDFVHLADLQVTKTDGSATAVPGQSVAYTIVFSNAGPQAAPGSSLGDTVVAPLTGCAWTCAGAGGAVCPSASGSGGISEVADLPSGSSLTYVLTCGLPASATGTVGNTATIAPSAYVLDGTPANNSATDLDTLVPAADLSITKDDGLGTATPGQGTTYTITATNAGPSSAPAATVADSFPGECTSVSWTCVAAGGASCAASGSGNISDTVSMPVGGSAIYTAVCSIAAAATGTLSNTATVGSAVGDPSPANNTATDSDTLTPSADLSLTLADSADPIPVFGNVTYTAAYANAGPSNATGATLSLTLPAGLSFVSSVPGTPACAPSGGVVSCALGGVTAGAGGTVTVTASANPGTLGSVTTNAQVGAAQSDPAAGNNSDSESTLVKFVKGDLQNDLWTDLFLGNTVTRENRIWLMNGTTQFSDQVFNPATPSSAAQQVAGVDDFDGDHRNDLVFWNSATGAVEFWLMNGVNRIGAPVPPSGAPTLSTNWKLSATADFNADGRPDIVWRNFTSQKIVIWTMNGTAKLGNIIPTPDQAVDPNWEVVGAFDLNGDGSTDFLWYNYSSGKIVYWWMNGAVQRIAGNFTSPANAGDSNWKVLAGGDYGVGPGGLPGTVDVVWRNADSGRYVVWFLDQAGNRTFGTFTTPMEPAVNPTDWTIVGPR